MNLIIILNSKTNYLLQYIAAPKMIALVSIYRAISRYIDATALRGRGHRSCL